MQTFLFFSREEQAILKFTENSESIPQNETKPDFL